MTDRCACRCDGMLHGQTHSDEWIKGIVEELHGLEFKAEQDAAHEAGQQELFT